jgi:butyrate kinase
MIHPPDELRNHPTILDQYPYRLHLLKNQIAAWGIQKGDLSAVVGRSALRKKESGVYRVNEKMLSDMKTFLTHRGHAAGLGCMLAEEVGGLLGAPAYVVHFAPDPLPPLAVVSGIPLIERRPVYHVQNIREVAMVTAAALGKPWAEANLIVAHLEGGMSVAAFAGGRLLDVSNAFEEGPFTTERSGALPVASLVDLCFSGRYSAEAIHKMIRGEGGMVAYLGTNKIGEIEKRIAEGDEKAAFYLEAMCYQAAKEIGAMASVLKGQVDAVVLTGKLLESERAVRWIEERCRFIAPVRTCPEQEAPSFARAVLRVLRGEDTPKTYA